MSILKIAATGAKLAAAGALAIGGLYALGKTKDCEQSKAFAFNIDADIKLLLKKIGIVENRNLFSDPVSTGGLNENIISIRLRVRRADCRFERIVSVMAITGGKSQELEATRSYDSESIPTTISEAMLKSRKSIIEWLIYSK